MNDRTPLITEQIYNAPIEKVWKAITNNDDMQQWYFKLADFKPEMGFEFQFEGGDESRTYLHFCKVTEVVPGKKITYSWSYDGFEAMSYVTWELFAQPGPTFREGGKTKLILTHTGLETFPQDNPSFAKESFTKGWAYITGTSLKNYLEK
jgi:uncharacterized protein YndB with AHSA1/START domain